MLLRIPARLWARAQHAPAHLPGTAALTSFELSFYLFVAGLKQLQWFPSAKSLHLKHLCLLACGPNFLHMMSMWSLLQYGVCSSHMVYSLFSELHECVPNSVVPSPTTG